MSKCLYCGKKLNSGETDFHPDCSLQFFGTKIPPKLDYSLDEMDKLAKEVVENSITVPGIQPKLSLGFVQNTVEKAGRLTVLRALGGNYILKPANKHFPGISENEYLTMQMAEFCGIEVVPFSLIRLKSGELSYITKRMDRTKDGKKLHQLDMFQITEAVDKYRSSMEKVGKAVAQYSANTLMDLLRLFEVTVFSFITGNNDMHLKNFSLLLKDKWLLSPAYDLLNVGLHIPEDREEMALTVNGRKRNLTKEDFIRIGTNFNLNEKQINNAFQHFLKKEEEMIDLIENSFLTQKNREKYIHLLKRRLRIIG